MVASALHTADAVVIGGGIVGCMTAYFLAKADVSVTLIESQGIATGTSGSCMGHLMVLATPAPTFELTHASVLLWHELAAELGDFEFNPTGVLWLAEDEGEVDLLEDMHARLRNYGDDGLEMLTGAQLRRREPGVASDLPAALFYALDAVVLPMFAAHRALRGAVTCGARVLTHTRVRGIRRDSDGVVCAVDTDRGAVATPVVVNAAGVGAPAVHATAGLPPLPIYPRRGDLAITSPRTCPVQHQLLEVGYLRSSGAGAVDPRSGEADPGGHALNVQPQSHGTCLIGSTRQFASRRVVEPPLLRASLRRAMRFVPGLAGAQITRTWAGLRPYSADKLPIIGPVDEAPGLYLASGHEGLGITLAPITGRLISQMVTGAPPSVSVEPWAYSRFAKESLDD